MGQSVSMVSLVGGVLLAGCGSGGTPDPIVPVQSPPEPPAPSSVLVWADQWHAGHRHAQWDVQL